MHSWFMDGAAWILSKTIVFPQHYHEDLACPSRSVFHEEKELLSP